MKSKSGCKRLFAAIGYSADGIRAAYRHEAGFRQLLALHGVLLLAVWCFDFDTSTRIILIAVSFLSLAVELLNTGIETVVDYISLEKHPLAKRAKDVGSAAQWLVLLMILIVWLTAWLG
ncbi:diacylglycerol kinase [Conchiformibius kuhniae]|uniref:Diacylglycerol kinase n=1 Tax=Conchiformibius kuhniae TaxID=211502 RepID=A0A8T9MZV3_9NEIS|nr:diacylglycerol kinase [Conchiformibius kuhniae]UOP05732.1 diacylglycerol kinase [Conchiformibius kuhniae]